MSKNKAVKMLLFVINFLVLTIGILFFRNQENNKVAPEFDEKSTGISPEVQDSQNQISVDRENKLRDLNNVPKGIGQIQQETTTTTTTTQAASKPASSSSSSSSKSSTKTKTS